MKKIIIFILLATTLMGKVTPQQIDMDIQTLFGIVSPFQDIRIGDDFYQIDMIELLEMTAQVESRYGQDNYNGRVAKTPFQFELDTANHYVSLVKELKGFLESEIGRELKVENEQDCVYITYLIYMSKLRYHRRWVEKLHKKYFKGDVEWFIYKIFWNSTKGASTYKKFRMRKNEKDFDKATRLCYNK